MFKEHKEHLLESLQLDFIFISEKFLWFPKKQALHLQHGKKVWAQKQTEPQKYMAQKINFMLLILKYQVVISCNLKAKHAV